jgi:hypothetical protein
MQNCSTGSSIFANAMNSSEFRMLMDSFCIPQFMRRALGGDLDATTRATWDRLCQQYYEVALGSPDGITWRDVLIPFGISLDNAPIHLAYRKEALLPRLTRLQEFTTLFEHAITGLDFNIEEHVTNEFKREIWKRRQKLANNSKWSSSKKMKARAGIALLKNMLQRYRFASAKFYVDCQFNKLGSDEARIVMPVFRRVSTHFDTAREAYRARNNGVDWISIFRRDQAVIDRRWLVFLPEQYMPLGNTTPDLHQVAEALVFRCKQAMRGWVLTRRPGDDAVLCAKNYDEVLQAHVHKSNDGAVGVPQDKDSIRKQLSRMWTTAQVVAADYGTQFIPDLPPNSETGANERGTTTPVIGTGGRFPPKQLS